MYKCPVANIYFPRVERIVYLFTDTVQISQLSVSGCWKLTDAGLAQLGAPGTDYIIIILSEKYQKGEGDLPVDLKKTNLRKSIPAGGGRGDGVCSISTPLFLLLGFPFTNLFLVIESSTAETLTSIDFSSCRDITNMLVYFLIILPLILFTILKKNYFFHDTIDPHQLDPQNFGSLDPDLLGKIAIISNLKWLISSDP